MKTVGCEASAMNKSESKSFSISRKIYETKVWGQSTRKYDLKRIDIRAS